MNKKIILIQILIVFFMLGIVIYNISNTKEEEFCYDNIVQNANIDEETKELENYIKIHITGQVKNQGIIELEEGSRISDAIEKAGGITSMANLENVNLAYVLQDGQKVYIPSIDENNNKYIIDGIDENIIETGVASNKKININNASEEELQTIPGIGPAMAQKIISYRKENGKFKSIEDIKNVSGIGDKKYENIKEYICVK